MSQINIQIKSFDSLYIENTLKKMYEILIYLKIYDFKIIKFPESRKKLTLLRSPHIDKKSREQFELKKHKSLLTVLSKKKSYSFLFLHFLKNSEFFGVELKISLKYKQFFCLPSVESQSSLSSLSSLSVGRQGRQERRLT